MRGFSGKNLLAAVTALALAALVATSCEAGAVDDAVLAEMNFARAHPQDYARRLMLQPVSDWERALASTQTDADSGAVAEAIDFLMRQTPLPPLRRDAALDAAAGEHVAAQGPAGVTGHDSADGERFNERLRRHGVAAAVSAENIAYGPSAASDVVRELIIDAGVVGRGHRHNIFHSDLTLTGVACGPHAQYAAMCVMDFAGAPAFDVTPWAPQDLRLALLTPPRVTPAFASVRGDIVSRLLRWL